MYARTSKLSCLSPLLPVLFKRIRCTNTWFAPHYKLFLNAVLPNARWSWIWVILPLFLWTAVFHRLRILILLLNSVFPKLTDCASSFYRKGVVVIFSKEISNALIANSQSIPKAITYWVLIFTINCIVTHDVPLAWESQRWFVNERLRPSFPFSRSPVFPRTFI